jgi:hypothetical protein
MLKKNYRLRIQRNKETVFESFGEFYKRNSEIARICVQENLPRGHEYTYEIVKIK